MAITREDLMRAGIGTGGMNPNVIPVQDMRIAGLPAAAPMQAAPMPAQAAPQRQGLLGGFFGPQGRDARARLAIGLEGLTMNPNQALIGQLQQGIESRETAAQKNATAAWLRSRGRDDLAAAMEGGLPAADALRIAMAPADPMAAINLETAQLELQRLRDGGVDPEKAFANEVELMKAYRTEPAVQTYNLISGHYNTMLSAYNTTQTDPAAQGAGDLAMVYSYMKMLDPNSTVMQGEYASASNTSGVPDRVRNTYNAVIEGAGLTPAQRQAFLTQAGGMLQVRAQPLAGINELYSGTAQRGGVQPNFLITPPPLPSFIPAVVPPSAASQGVTQEDWAAMTQDERRAFMEGQ
jgi:hypothetical protein